MSIIEKDKIKIMKRKSSKTASKTIKKQIKYKFDRKDNTLLESTIKTNKGNKSIFKIIIDKNEPDIKQTLEE